jgi:hypothetical protein
VWFPEVVRPALRRADALPRALAAWDAWGDVRRDEAVDAADLRLDPRRAGAAEKLVGRARDGPVQADLRRRLELRVAPEAELAAPAPYTRVAGQFVERSCAVRAEAETLVLPQPEVLAVHSPKPLETEAQAQQAEAPAVVTQYAPEVWLRVKTRPERRKREAQQPEQAELAAAPGTTVAEPWRAIQFSVPEEWQLAG